MLLVFDFDGTVADSIHDLAESASELSEIYGGRRLDDRTVTLMVGEGAHTLVERILATAGVVGSQPDALSRFPPATFPCQVTELAEKKPSTNIVLYADPLGGLILIDFYYIVRRGTIG